MKQIYNYSKRFFALALIVLCANQSYSQSGFCYRDYNKNGTKDSREIGVSGVLVKSFTVSGAILGTATTGSDGSYTLSPAATAGQQVRVEFTLPVTGTGCAPSTTQDYAGFVGTADGSSVKFVTGAAANTNFSVIGTTDINDSNPKVGLVLRNMGNPLDAAGTAKDDTTYVWFNYNYSGVPIIRGGTAPNRIPLARASETGSIWGNAYSKYANKIFVSAVLRRHSGMGPLGSGGIYMIDPTLPLGSAVSNFLDLDAIGIATKTSGYTTQPFTFPTVYAGCNSGFYPILSDPAVAPRVPFTTQIGSNADRGLPNIQAPSNDYAAFSQIGKVSLGDIDISDDGRYLFVTNLFDQKIYRIDLTSASNPVAPTLANVATKVTSWSLPPVTAINGTLRPWGLKSKGDSLFVGIVADNGNEYFLNGSQASGKLMGYVYGLNTTTSGWTQKVSFDFANRPYKTTLGDSRWWGSWWDSPYNTSNNGPGEKLNPQPIISDIEVDDNGDLVLGISDRFAMQGGTNQHYPSREFASDFNVCGFLATRLGFQFVNSPLPIISCDGFGDILRVKYNNTACSYTFQTGTAADGGGCQAGTGTEYYCEDAAGGGLDDKTNGALALLHGSNEVMTTTRTSGFYAQGASRMNNTTGKFISEYQVSHPEYIYIGTEPVLIGQGPDAKGNGLGDIELISSNIPVEVGNRIWDDIDNDGIQDANEAGIANVKVNLYYESSPGTYSLLTSTTTNANGNYSFTNLQYQLFNLGATSGNIIVSLDPSQYNTTTNELVIGTNVYHLSPSNVTDVVDAVNSDVRDNDAMLSTIVGAPFAGMPSISFNIATQADVKNNYSFDFGLNLTRVLPIRLESFTALPLNNSVTLNWKISQEINVNRYEIEYSTNGINFVSIGYVSAKGNQLYTLQHNMPVNGINYYRLKTIDADGSSVYSEVRKVNFGRVIINAIIYPNPAKENINITLTGRFINKAGTIKVLSIDGKLLMQKNLKAMNQTESIDVRKIANGKYVIQIITDTDIVNKSIQIIK